MISAFYQTRPHDLKEVYSEDYWDSARRFVRTATGFGAAHSTYPVSDNRYSNDEADHLALSNRDLACDAAFFGDSEATKRLLIVTTGLHGPEGFAGSAVALNCMPILARLTKENPEFGVLMVHALNPEGMANGTRENAEGVDPNRNFLSKAEFDHAPKVMDALRLATTLMRPHDRCYHWKLADVAKAFKILTLGLIIGAKGLQQQISQGQAISPLYPYYCGRKPSWSNRTWFKIVSEYVNRVDVAVHLDLHTGLGKYGAAEAMLYGQTGAPVHAYFRALWAKATTSVSAACPGAQNTTTSAFIPGDITGWTRLLEQAPRRYLEKRVHAATLEFGTYNKVVGLWRLRLHNWMLVHPLFCTSWMARQIKHKFRDYFYPQDLKWRKMVLDRGTETVLTTARALATEVPAPLRVSEPPRAASGPKVGS